MDASIVPQLRDRHDRHVRHARLCVSPGAPRHRLAFTVEEALRLASLPGEDEGRCYYFHCLRVSGLPASGDRARWLEIFQRALLQQASQAIHGSDPRGAAAPAVFFRNEVEALEILLHRILRDQSIHEWFWPMVTASPGSASSKIVAGGRAGEAMIPGIIDRIRATSAAWVAVAATIFTAPGLDAIQLLAVIPPAVAEAWLREMDVAARPAFSVAPRFSPTVRRSIERALRILGIEDARALWIATLGVILESPVELIGGAAVWRARIALQKMASEGLVGDVREEVGSQSDDESAPLELRRVVECPQRFDIVAALSEPTIAGLSPTRTLLESNPTTPPDLRPAVTPWYCSGLPTSVAGLFFLMNALERIGIARAFSAGLGSADPQFAARLMQRFAVRAGVGPDDPIRLWIDSIVTTAPDTAPIACDADWWPSNLPASRTTASIDYLARIWYLAVLRWCWRTGKLTLPVIVSRGGVFSVNRTDLDVSMPLDEADVRVRRLGLDLDPGWLPWFGRVVRFHYLHRGGFNG